jgi:hypothetical protein
MTDRSLTRRMADQLDRQAFAALVLRAGSDHQHETCAHADCAVHASRCPLREALEASSDRINREGQALLAEYHQRREGERG